MVAAKKKSGIRVASVADYVSKVSSKLENGEPRRVAAIEAMMEDCGVDNFVVQITIKGVDYYVFKV